MSSISGEAELNGEATAITESPNKAPGETELTGEASGETALNSETPSVIKAASEAPSIAAPIKPQWTTKKLAEPRFMTAYRYTSAIRPNMLVLTIVTIPFFLLIYQKFFHNFKYPGIDNYISSYGMLLAFFVFIRLLPNFFRSLVISQMQDMIPQIVMAAQTTNMAVDQVNTSATANKKEPLTVKQTIQNLENEVSSMMECEKQLQFALSGLKKDSHLYKVYSAQLSMAERTRRKAEDSIAFHAKHDADGD